MKRLCSYILVIALCFLLLPTATVAAESGTCGNLSWSYNDGVLTISGYGAMPDFDTAYADTRAPWYLHMSLVHTVIIKNGVTSIGAEAFYNYDLITSIDLPSSIRSIGDRAFLFCNALEDVPFPPYLTYIGENAFAFCPLKEIVLPESLTALSNKAFYHCSKATTLVFGSKLASLGAGAFEGCTSIKEISLNQGMNIGASAFRESGLTKLSIPDRTEGAKDITIGKKAFERCAYLEELSIGDSVTSISNYAFNECSVLKKVTFSNRVTSIGDYAFCRNLALQELTFPDALTYIGEFAFMYCTALRKVTMGTSPVETDQYSFMECNKLEEVHISDLSAWCESDFYEYSGNPLYFAKQLYLNGDLVEHLIVPEDVTFIGTAAFYQANCLKTVVLPQNVSKIGWLAFGLCNNLERITVLDPNCTIVAVQGYSTTGTTKKTVLHGWKGSTLQTHAETYGYTFTAHEETLSETAAPQCAQPGSCVHYCSVCDLSYTETIAPLGHDYASTSTDPTCTEGSVTTYVCNRCADTYTTIGEPLGHAYESEITDPTCTDGGFTEYTCSVCGDHYVADHTEPNGHSYIAQITKPTCTDGGFTEYTCSVCGDSYIADHTEPSSHDYIAQITEPTCTAGGFTEYTCSVCGDSYTEPISAYCPSAYLQDVSLAAWYHNAVDYVLENGLMNGMSATTFEPETSMSRAMLVTVLWRFAGSPIEGENNFTDVPDGQWYTDAVAWASHNGIVGGVGDNQFAPNGNITREQLATILYRYCNANGIDTSNEAILSSYPDCDKISSYAIRPLAWAVAEGLINGIEVNSRVHLQPQGNATRAQVATILMRFIENLLSNSTGGYEAIIRQAMNTYGEFSNGILYDLDQDGTQELILMYRTVGTYGGEMRYGVYTMEDNTVITVFDDVSLYAEAGSNDGWVGIVKYDGQLFFGTYYQGGMDYLAGHWRLYRHSGSVIELCYDVDFCRYLTDEGRIDYDRSYASINDEVVSFGAYEDWEYLAYMILTINGFAPSNLQTLLSQLS